MQHVLVLTLHHIIADGWSIGVILEELAALYVAVKGDVTALAEPKIQYTDCAVWQQEKITDSVLGDRANRLAHYLINLGVKPESRVGLWVARSLDLVVAIQAILKAGGAYVPLTTNILQSALLTCWRIA